MPGVNPPDMPRTPMAIIYWELYHKKAVKFKEYMYIVFTSFNLSSSSIKLKKTCVYVSPPSSIDIKRNLIYYAPGVPPIPLIFRGGLITYMQ